jgi:hypothetical protein
MLKLFELATARARTISRWGICKAERLSMHVSSEATQRGPRERFPSM